MADTTSSQNNRLVAYGGRPSRERRRTMPWSGKSFGSRHNHAASPTQAKKGSEMANAMLREGVPEGVAIATANKHIQKMKKRGAISPKAAAKHLSKYGNEDNIDASSR